MAEGDVAGYRITRSESADRKLDEARTNPDAYFRRVRAAVRAATWRNSRPPSQKPARPSTSQSH